MQSEGRHTLYGYLDVLFCETGRVGNHSAFVKTSEVS